MPNVAVSPLTVTPSIAKKMYMSPAIGHIAAMKEVGMAGSWKSDDDGKNASHDALPPPITMPNAKSSIRLELDSVELASITLPPIATAIPVHDVTRGPTKGNAIPARQVATVMIFAAPMGMTANGPKSSA
mmetsp:Transcript_65656/g.181695  ORF Transcript_65656/g.181695 Transcript_65656/m.181695 type:complete len:130 (-) Transcript_65656:427-816(-)